MADPVSTAAILGSAGIGVAGEIGKSLLGSSGSSSGTQATTTNSKEFQELLRNIDSKTFEEMLLKELQSQEVQNSELQKQELQEMLSAVQQQNRDTNTKTVSMSAEQRQQQANLLTDLIKSVKKGSQYTREAAIEDSQLAVKSAIDRILDSGIGDVAGSIVNTGGYDSTVTANMANTLGRDAAEVGAKLQLSQIATNAQLANQEQSSRFDLISKILDNARLTETATETVDKSVTDTSQQTDTSGKNNSTSKTNSNSTTDTSQTSDKNVSETIEDSVTKTTDVDTETDFEESSGSGLMGKIFGG